VKKEYRIKACSRDSSEYGVCERCRKTSNPHYKQQWRKVDSKAFGWINAGYGHADCLKHGAWGSTDKDKI